MTVYDGIPRSCGVGGSAACRLFMSGREFEWAV